MPPAHGQRIVERERCGVVGHVFALYVADKRKIRPSARTSPGGQYKPRGVGRVSDRCLTHGRQRSDD